MGIFEILWFEAVSFPKLGDIFEVGFVLSHWLMIMSSMLLFEGNEFALVEITLLITTVLYPFVPGKNGRKVAGLIDERN